MNSHTSSTSIIRNGLTTGMILQLAIGPVFFYIVNLSLQRTLLDGLMAVLAVTLVDYLYIALAILGVGKLLEYPKIKRTFGIVSSIVLLLFGLFTIWGAVQATAITAISVASSTLLSSFFSTFLLTISSPMGIVFWTSVFATKVIETGYSKRELAIFGTATGAATFLFMGTAAVLSSFLKGAIPFQLVQLLNIIVGCVLVGYGGIRLMQLMRK